MLASSCLTNVACAVDPNSPSLDTAPSTQTGQDCQGASERIARWFSDAKGELSTSGWSAELVAALSLEKLRSSRALLEAHFGALKDVGPMHRRGSSDTQYGAQMQFESKVADLLTSCNERGELASVKVLPSNAPTVYRQGPPLTDATEEVVDVGIGATRPVGASVVWPAAQARAVVVIVGGSGPIDRDGKIGVNTPLRDLAAGLAKLQIASIRFDKRTLVHPDEFAHTQFTPDLEAVDDAVAAANHLTTDPRSKDLPLFLLGHSFGGELVARVARRISARPKGLVLLATPSTELLTAVQRQRTYLHSLGVTSDSENAAQAAALDREIENWNAYRVAGKSNGPFPLGLPASYLTYLSNLSPAQEIRQLDLPVLVLQGGMDYQVLPDVDFVELKKKLDNLGTRADYKLYPSLNHIFFSTTTKGPSSYYVPGHMDDKVISDIAKWIHTASGK